MAPPPAMSPMLLQLRTSALYGFTALMGMVALAVMINDFRQGNWHFVALEAAGALMLPLIVLLVQRNHHRLASILALSALWMVTTAIAVTGLGVMGNAVLYLAALPTMAGLLLGIRGALTWMTISVGTLLALTLLHQPDLNAVASFRAATDTLDRVIDLFSLLVLLGLATGGMLWLQEKSLAQMQQAVEAARLAQQAQARFLATMSHEIRTPINGVIGATHLLESTPLRNDQRELLAVVDTSAALLLHLINDILDYSRLEGAPLALEQLPVSLADLARDVCTPITLQATQKGLRLQTDIDPALPAHVLSDPTRLRQILINLLGNAVKFTAEGTVVLRFAVAPATQPPRWILQVQDSGIGISSAVLPHLFQPFSQADASTTRRFGGSGLGLAIVHRIVEQMGGTVHVQSTPGMGATFTVALPLHPATLTPDPPAARSDDTVVPDGGLRVLLVDDHPINRLIAQQQLRQRGHRVQEAVDGHEAIALAKAGDWDVVLMDCQMPELDGYAATRAIRALPGAAGQVPIIGLSANAMPGDRERALSAGMDDYLTKPVRAEVMLETIARLAVRTRKAAGT